MVRACEKNVKQQNALRWLEWKPNTARPRGRPRKRWMDNVKEAVEVGGSTLKETEQSALFSVHGQKPMEKLRTRYKVQDFFSNEST